MKLRSALLAAALIVAPTITHAEGVDIPAAATLSATTIALPSVLTAEQRTAWRNVFAAIRSGDWSTADAGIGANPAGPLSHVARAELLIAKGSPKVTDDALSALLVAAPDLPEAQAVARIATQRRLSTPTLPLPRDLVRLAGPSKRSAARAIRSDRAAAQLSQGVTPLLRADQPTAAEALVTSRLTELSPEAQAEWLQRVAWSYYQTGDDASAMRVATQAQGSSLADWGVQAAWVNGLAAWRSGNCNAAAIAFDHVGSQARDSETMAAGLYWTARADMACGRPDRVEPRLRSAARMKETFYGLLAQGQLGMAARADIQPRLTANDWAAIGAIPNVVRATALAEIGENALADQMLRHQARIGRAQDHESLVHLANRLDLPETQIWLAQNGPAGSVLSAACRYPMPGWAPVSGWQVDKALIFAHALQESQFKADATSPAGARGVMQLMPATAQMVARHQGRTIDADTLGTPAQSIELGQAYLRELADSGNTGGLLPKVIAAYNAGPGSVANWNARGRNLADPLLFIESIPFAETRAYVAIVLRNYWMYQRQAGVLPTSLTAMAQGLWPRFPGLPGREAVRLTAVGSPAAAD
ncbi:lytic transglycosylase domain-containing protein [Sphingomonas montanisoli]|uniref:Lytic transglycosylase domain-containing protein n=1 Tax=Sphingomonas montanisoli TaxID=2606412 RepID=A0A5D9CBM3_9SPHN|nr:lytic transglycosylase domain-containing protein [Sphingomonas montanisoli]TZG29129.1 lytic transglycosylase domain-containing protein [Sphingomonas montanisoli]